GTGFVSGISTLSLRGFGSQGTLVLINGRRIAPVAAVDINFGRGSLMLASHALALVGVPMRRVIRMTRDARDARYGLLRGYFHGADDDTVEELHQARLLTVGLPPASAVIGQRLGDLALHALGVEVVSVRHAGGSVQRPEDDLLLQADDTLVLSGVPEALALAEAKLLKG
ncbi:MAG: TrkA C-terminal domain-containing protein, partial [Betaproteobacteria bacterium]